jgi:hypothetical protein
MLYVAPFIAAKNKMLEKASCMSISQIQSTLKFDFRTPSYLPPDYHYQCGRASTGEALVVYWNQSVSREELDYTYDEYHKGAIVQFIQSEPQIKDGTAAVLSQYKHILNVSSINVKLIDLGYGRVAWANDVGGGLPARLRTFYDDGYSLSLEGYVPLDELAKMAKSLR